MTDAPTDEIPPVAAPRQQTREEYLATLTGIERAEAEHGFKFGGGEPLAMHNATIAVICSNPRCERRTQHVQLHADTAMPVHCGGCGQIVHCEHPDTELETHHEGTLSSPVRVLTNRCKACGVAITQAKTPLSAIPLDQIPLHLLGGVSLDKIIEPSS